MSQEIELKLALPPEALSALSAHPLVRQAQTLGPPQQLNNSYYDTPALELRREKIAVRLRQAGTQWVQTIKCAAVSVGGLSSRPEWETPWNGKQFDFSTVSDVAVRERLCALQHRIVPSFSTNFERRTLRLRGTDGASVLMMIDHGHIEAGGQREALCEVELELESGKVGALFDIALALARELPLKPDDRSKAQRGYALCSPQRPQARRAGPSPLRAGQDAVAAFRAIGFDVLAMWVANDVHLGSADPEFVHQTRVALRRLRSAFTLFKEVLEPSQVEAWRQRLGELASLLGGSRDGDVVRAHFLQPVIEARTAKKHADDDLARLAAALETHCKDAQQGMLERLAQHQSGLAMLQLAADLHALPHAGTLTVDELAQLAMRRTRRKARGCVEAAEAGDINELHRLRIVLKRLRYGLEFFAPLWPSKLTQSYGQTLAQLQDELGEINDAATANRLLAEVAGSDPGLVAARAYVAGWHATHIEQLRQRALSHAREILWAQAPWQQGKRA